MGKGTNTTTSSTAPNPFVANSYLQLLNRASNVAGTPYQPYTGQLTADVNSQQQAGIGAINQNAGFASPYIQEAAGFARGAASPITSAEISNYQSPYTQQVVDATSNWFNTQNQQQQQNVVGNAAAQGALGGDRVGVAQANLASQQTASQAPIIAGLYNQGYTQALGTAERQRANLGNAAYSIGNLGVAGQNAALTGANAQIGAGNLLYGNDQDRLNKAYQQFQIAQAFPYQQTQWLAGVDTGVGSQMGGNSSTTAPAPNPWAQYAGLGLTAAGMFLKRGGRIPGFAPGGTVDDTPYAGVGWIPTRQITMGAGAPRAPGVGPAPQAASFKPMDFGGRFGRNGAGDPLDISSGVGGFLPSGMGDVLPMGISPEAGFGLGPIYRHGGGVRGYDVGGGVADDLPLNFADRWAATPEAIRAGVFDPQGVNYTTGERSMVSDAGVVPMPRPRPETAPVAGFAPTGEDSSALGFAPEGRSGPRVMTPQGMAQPDADGVYPADATMMPGNPLGDVSGAMPFAEASPSAGVSGPSPAPEQRRGFNLGFVPDNLRMPLMSAGLAMMASRSPNLGNAIGEGGLAGVGAYTQQKQAELQHAEKREALGQTNRRIENETKRLDQAAEQSRKHLEEVSRHNLVTEDMTREQRATAAMQPVKIGTDKAGRDIYGVRDPKTHMITPIDPDTGQPRGAEAAPKPNYINPQTGRPFEQTTEADGVIPTNAQLVSSGTPYDYSEDAPYIEKGMDVPKPAPTANKSTASIQTDAEYYLQTGKLPPIARGRSPVAVQTNNYRTAVQNYANSVAQSRGLSPEQTADMWRTAPGMLRFILGADGRSTVALGTAVRHLDTVQQLAKAWEANDIQAVNRIRAVISREFGKEAATNLEAAGRIVGPEIIKALGVAGAGTEHDRNTASGMFSAATSPAQLAGAAQTVQKLLGGQLEGRKRQAMNAGVSEERFKSLIGDRPYEMLSNADKPAPTLSDRDKQALDWANANPKDPRALEIKKRLGAP